MDTPAPRGRPPVGPESATSRIVMRTTPHRKGAYVRAALAERLALNVWMRKQLDAAAKYNPQK